MNKKNILELKCSPGTFGRIKADEEYRGAVAQHVAGEDNYDEIIFSPHADENSEKGTQEYRGAVAQNVVGEDNHNEIIFSPNADENSEKGTQETPTETQQSACCSTASDAKKTLWLEASTKFLIARVKDLRRKVGKTASLKTKKQMWNQIAAELQERGHDFNSVQVETKFFGLERQYKRMRLNNSKTGRNRQTCPFQNELDDLLQDKRSLNPDYLLDSETEVASKDLSSNEETNSSISEQLDVTPSTSKKRKTPLQEFMQKREVSDRMLQKSLDENFKQKAERAERKELLEKKKIELLESLFNVLKK